MIPLRDNIPSRTFPFVNYLLIAANAVVFYFQLRFAWSGSLDQFIHAYSLIPGNFVSNFPQEIPTLFTSMFMHGGWLHFLGNMLYLYIFGDNVEDRLGHFKYLIFYLFCGCAAAVLQIYFSGNSLVPMIGASGAISGVLGAYLLLYPKARILTLVPIWIFLRIFEIRGIYYLGFWFILQLLSGMASLKIQTGNTGGVAFWAHVGGFAAGMLWIFVFGKRKR